MPPPNKRAPFNPGNHKGLVAKASLPCSLAVMSFSTVMANTNDQLDRI